MTKKRKPGRPPKRKQDKQGIVITFKATAADRAMLKRKSAATGLSPSAWLRKLIIEAP